MSEDFFYLGPGADSIRWDLIEQLAKTPDSLTSEGLPEDLSDAERAALQWKVEQSRSPMYQLYLATLAARDRPTEGEQEEDKH